MSKLLLWIGGLFLAVLVALFTVPHFVNWNSFRGEFEEQASRILQRDVRVGGAVILRLLPTPYVHFEKLRISDTTGTLGEPFFRVDGFTMGLSVLPLLKGAIEARYVELAQPVLTLGIGEQGRGNWGEFKHLEGTIPLLPASISLRSVTVTDGAISVRRGADGEIVRLERINGELTADNLRGPYKFRGALAWDESVREVRLSTAPADADGTIRFKALVASATTGANYTLEGGVVDLMERPQLNGELVGRVPYQPVAGDGGKKHALDLRARVFADTAGASLSEMTVAFDNDGQPQLISGEALATWHAGTRVNVKLNSRWLDLDRLAAGSKASLGPFDTVSGLLPGLVGTLPRTSRVEIQLTVDQINIGGQAASNLGLAVERAERGPMRVKALRVMLPGASRLELDGNLVNTGGTQSFDGRMALRGASVARFLRWVAPDLEGVAIERDGPFALQGRTQLNDRSFDLVDANAELLGRPLVGGVSYRWGERRQLDLLLDGPKIDLSSVLPGQLGLDSALALVWPGGAAQPAATAPATPAQRHAFDPRVADVSVQIRAGELSDGVRVLRDVQANVRAVAGSLTLTQLKLTTPEGLQLDLEGEVRGLAEKPDGALRGVVTAAGTRGLVPLLSFVQPALTARQRGAGLADGAILYAPAERLAPLRLAGTVRVGAENGAAHILLDGMMRDARVVGRVRLERGLDDWRQGKVELDASVDDTETALALAQALAGGTASATSVADLTGSGTVTIKATGIPAKGMLAIANVRTENLQLDYDGQVVMADVGFEEVDGSLLINAQQAHPMLALAGLGPLNGLAEQSLAGRVDVNLKAGELRLRPRGLKVGGNEMAGLLRIYPGAQGRRAFDGVLGVPVATVSGLMQVALGHQRGTVGRVEPTSGRGGQASLRSGELPMPSQAWPDAPFDLSSFASLEGKLKLRVGRLVLDDGLVLREAVIETEVAPGKVEVKRLEGTALGGTMVANVAITEAAAGATIAGALQLDGANLGLWGKPARADGSASLNLQFSGSALSPLAYLSVAKGKGSVRIANVRLKRFWPGAISATASGFVEGLLDPTEEAFRQALEEALVSQAASIGSRRIAMTLADGAVQLERFGFATSEASASVETTVDLATLKIDSEWRLTPKDQPEGKVVPPPPVPAGQQPLPSVEDQLPPLRKGPLPPVSIVYVGALGSVPDLTGRMDADALQREIAVRKMERDVRELERLRLLDELRAAQEAERRQALEEAAAAAEALRRAAQAEGAAGAQNEVPSGGVGNVPQRPVRPPGIQ